MLFSFTFTDFAFCNTRICIRGEILHSQLQKQGRLWVGMVDAEGVGASLLDQVVQGGVFFAVPVFLIALFLFIQGSKQIPLTVGVVGLFVGFGLSGQLYAEFVDVSLPVTEQQFRIIVPVVLAGVSISVAKIAMRFLAAGMVFLLATNLIAVGDRFGYDFEGDAFLSGILTLIAFISSYVFRRLVPAMMAGLVGALGMMFSIYVALGWPVERLDGVTSPDAYLAIPLMLISCYIQYKYFMEKLEEKEAKEFAEEDKDYIF
jgi:hypothetical protein